MYLLLMSEAFCKLSKIKGIAKTLFELPLIICRLLLFACRLKCDRENFSLIGAGLLGCRLMKIFFEIAAGCDCLLRDEIGFIHVEFDLI